MEMSGFVVFGAVGVLVSLIIVVIAIGSLIILSNSWFGRDTKERLTSLEAGQKKLEKGQAKLEADLKDIKENQVRFEKKTKKDHDQVLELIGDILKILNKWTKKTEDKPFLDLSTDNKNKT